MEQNIDTQYMKDYKNSPSSFKARARFHQSKFREYELKVSSSEYENCLRDYDAKRGLNFYDDFNIFEEAKKRYPNTNNRHVYRDMLRSQHIAFNLFVPFKSDVAYAKEVFNNLLSGQIGSIQKIIIEYAPKPRSRYLKDNTSFDSFMEYMHVDGAVGIIGIEVKYTERDYKLDPESSEAEAIQNKQSRYYQVTRNACLYRPDSISQLIADRYRQIWRNQLLGESILQVDSDKYKHFTSMTFFPAGNIHFVETSAAYMDMLVSNDDKFVPVTYEQFLAVCEQHCPSDRYKNWIRYLRRRYIVQDD